MSEPVNKEEKGLVKGYDFLINSFTLFACFFILSCFYFLFTGSILRAVCCFCGSLLNIFLVGITSKTKEKTIGKN